MQCVIMDWTEHLERNSEGPKPAEMAGKNHKLKHTSWSWMKYSTADWLDIKISADLSRADEFAHPTAPYLHAFNMPGLT